MVGVAALCWCVMQVQSCLQCRDVVSVSRQSRELTTSRLGLGPVPLGPRLGLGRKGLVHIPAVCWCVMQVERVVFSVR